MKPATPNDSKRARMLYSFTESYVDKELKLFDTCTTYLINEQYDRADQRANIYEKYPGMIPNMIQYWNRDYTVGWTVIVKAMSFAESEWKAYRPNKQIEHLLVVDDFYVQKYYAVSRFKRPFAEHELVLFIRFSIDYVFVQLYQNFNGVFHLITEGTIYEEQPCKLFQMPIFEEIDLRNVTHVVILAENGLATDTKRRIVEGFFRPIYDKYIVIYSEHHLDDRRRIARIIAQTWHFGRNWFHFSDREKRNLVPAYVREPPKDNLIDIDNLITHSDVLDFRPGRRLFNVKSATFTIIYSKKFRQFSTYYDDNPDSFSNHNNEGFREHNCISNTVIRTTELGKDFYRILEIARGSEKFFGKRIGWILYISDIQSDHGIFKQSARKLNYLHVICRPRIYVERVHLLKFFKRRFAEHENVGFVKLFSTGSSVEVFKRVLNVFHLIYSGSKSIPGFSVLSRPLQIPHLLQLLDGKRVYSIILDSVFPEKRNLEICEEMRNLGFEVVLREKLDYGAFAKMAISITKTLHGNSEEVRICFDEDSLRKGGVADVNLDVMQDPDYFRIPEVDKFEFEKTEHD